MHPLDKFKVPAKSGGRYNDGSPQAPTPYNLFRKSGTRTRNRSDGASTERLCSSNPSENHTQSSEEVPPCLDPSILGELETEPEMLLQPDTRPISHEQLVVEVKGIYAGLVMVEAKCIDIDERQSAAAQEKNPNKRINLKNDQWQSLIALHKQLLHEHHDFFQASQHPSANPALNRIAIKYSMPARMWRHGIHAFLEVLRHRLPESLEHMLAFIYIAYSMMALLYEQVSTFEDTWIECLGDLGRYRMAIEDDKPKDREVWSNVAHFWYHKAADKSPNVGRLYHHLAILFCPSTLEQLLLYTRSLTCITPFVSAKEDTIALFEPVLPGRNNAHYPSSSLDAAFLRTQGILFNRRLWDTADQYSAIIDDLIDDLEVNKSTGQRLRNLIMPKSDFPKPARESGVALPEDFVVRGLMYTQHYFPESWFKDITIDDGEWRDDLPSMAKQWIERMLRLGLQITSVCLPSPTVEAPLTDR